MELTWHGAWRDDVSPWVLAGPCAGAGDCSFLEVLSRLTWTPYLLFCLLQAVLHLALECSLQHIALSRSTAGNLPWLLTGQSQFLQNCRPFTTQALPLVSFWSPYPCASPAKLNSLCSSQFPSATMLPPAPSLPGQLLLILLHPVQMSPRPVLPFLLTERRLLATKGSGGRTLGPPVLGTQAGGG